MSDKPLVALIYQRPQMPWMFEGALRAGVDVLLVRRPRPLPDERLPEELPACVREIVSLDIASEPEKSVEALREIHSRTPISGVLAGSDGGVQFAAAAARALGLPGMDEAAAWAVRDKRETRRLLRDSGLNCPAFAALGGPDAWSEASHLSFPVVVKPAGGFTSMGVTRVDDPSELESVVRSVWAVCEQHLGYGKDTAAFEGLVVEEYLDGGEYCVESLSFDGVARVLTIGYKGTPEGPYFEETIYRAPAPLDDELRRAITAEVEAAHLALGVRNGPTHTELRIRDGKPYLLEMGARVGASGAAHHIVHGVTGVDFAAESFRTAMGVVPSCWDQPLRNDSVAAIYFTLVCGSGRIQRVVGMDETRSDPRVDEVVELLTVGDEILPYPEYSGMPGVIVSRHDTDDDAASFHRWLDDTVRFEYEP